MLSGQSKEHSRPGDTFNTDVLVEQSGAVAPHTLVALGECSIFFLPAAALSAVAKAKLKREPSKRLPSKNRRSSSKGAARNSMLNAFDQET